jgi:hypothetical protein
MTELCAKYAQARCAMTVLTEQLLLYIFFDYSPYSRRQFLRAQDAVDD